MTDALRIAAVEIHAVSPVGGGDICSAYRGTLDGRAVFAKTRDAAPRDFFGAEARGLERIRVPDGPPVPDVIAFGDDGLVLAWVERAGATPAAAEDFGRRLARLHGARQPHFGSDIDGFIGELPLDNTPTADWPTFYAERRLAPYLPSVPVEHRGVIESVCERIADLAGEPEPPALIHGDLWSGNLLWALDGRVWLVDAASAHAGHRETDLAMLVLFGAPHLERIIGAYDDVTPLADGWRQRVALHQLHPLLVHTAMFGGGYAVQAAHAARVALHAAD